MKKSLFFIICILALLLPVSANAFIIEYDGEAHEYTGLNCTLNVDGKEIKTPLMPPIIMNDRTLVPVRELCEALGAVVSYSSKHIYIDRDGDIIEMTVDNNITYVDGKKVKIPDGVTPKLINLPGMSAKTMVPARFIAETLGKTVDFDTKTNTVLIYGDPNTKKDEKVTLTTITNAEYKISNETKLTLTVEAEDSFKGDVSSFKLAEPERAVFDIPNTSLKLKNNTITIKNSPITAIRFGHDGNGKTRIVVDSESKVLTYKAVKNADVITITVSVDKMDLTPSPTTKPDEDDSTEKNPVTSTPEETTKPTTSPTPTTKPEGELPTEGPVVVPDSYKNIAKKIIVLDAGHGGVDPGAVSEVLQDKTIKEKDITLSIVLKVRDILKSKGYTVLTTRATDTYPTLNDRAELANRQGAAMFVSIHMNSSPSADPNGTETYYSEINNGDAFGATSSQLAKNIQTRLQKALNSINRGVKTANHAVTRSSIMPAVLIEVGFISNAKECELLITDSYQNKAASAIAEGIIATWDDITVPDDWEDLVLERVEALK